MARDVFTAAAILTFAAAAFAMTEMDLDRDGAVSLAEIQAAHPEITQEIFDQADTDGDGVLTEFELTEARSLGLLPEAET